MSDVHGGRSALHFVTMVTRVLAMLFLAAAAGATGLFVGRANENPDAGFDRGYHAGIVAERNVQRHEASRVSARYQPGSPGFETIFAAGRREGRRLGRYEGLAQGRRAGYKAGRKAGRTSTLPDFPGGWSASHWYLVRVESGADKRLRVGARVVIARGRQYGPCRADANRICTTPQL
jgi:hypothetical protein